MTRKSLNFSGIVEVARKGHQIVAEDRGNRTIPLEAGFHAVDWRKTPLEETRKGKLQISPLF